MDEKWGRRLFTAGAVVLLLLGAVHSLSLFEKPIPANETEKQLLDLMTDYHFNLMGSLRSMNDLLRGFSISFMAGAIALGVLGLSLRREAAGVLKRVALIITIWLAVMTGISLRYFFVMPTAFLAVALVIFVAAWIKIPGEDIVRNVDSGGDTE
jgi:hypothetical protein